MRKTLVLLAYILISTSAFAQPIPGGRPDDGGAGKHEDIQMPVATSTLLLLGLGTGYTVYKLHRKNRH